MYNHGSSIFPAAIDKIPFQFITEQIKSNEDITKIPHTSALDAKKTDIDLKAGVEFFRSNLPQLGSR